jgi:GT2 family glycosyltransferase
MRVAIIFVTWNRKGLVCEAIRSVFAVARCTDFEIIVVDNASTDGTADKVAKEFPSVRIIILHKNCGPVMGRNIGATNAAGDVLIFFDDDVVLKKDVIPLFLEKFRNDDKLAAVSGKVINYNTGKIESDFYPMFGASGQNDDLYVWNYHNEGAVAFRRDAFKNAGYYCDEYFRQGESQELSLRLYNLGYRIMYSPSIEVFHKSTPIMRDLNKINWHAARNAIWNDMLSLYGFELCITVLYRLFSYFGKVMTRRLSLGHFTGAMYEGIFKVPKHRKISYSREVRMLVDHLRTNRVTSTEGFYDLGKGGQKYILRRIKQMVSINKKG